MKKTNQVSLKCEETLKVFFCSFLSACQCECVQIYHLLHVLHHAAHLLDPGLLVRPASALFTGCQRLGLWTLLKEGRGMSYYMNVELMASVWMVLYRIHVQSWELHSCPESLSGGSLGEQNKWLLLYHSFLKKINKKDFAQQKPRRCILAHVISWSHTSNQFMSSFYCLYQVKVSFLKTPSFFACV